MSDRNPQASPSDGRAANGRFRPGNRIGVGNPFARRAQKIRAALFKAVKPSDIREAVKALVAQAKSGDRQALAEILDRTIGKSLPGDVEQRLADIEAQLAQRKIDDANAN